MLPAVQTHACWHLLKRLSQSETLRGPELVSGSVTFNSEPGIALQQLYLHTESFSFKRNAQHRAAACVSPMY
jgi:hypothetical protein